MAVVFSGRGELAESLTMSPDQWQLSGPRDVRSSGHPHRDDCAVEVDASAVDLGRKGNACGRPE